MRSTVKSALYLGAALGVFLLVSHVVPSEPPSVRGLLAESSPITAEAAALPKETEPEETGPKRPGMLRKLSVTGGMSDLRVAVFGGANAFGMGVENRFDAFPYLLSDTVDNYAHSSSGPNYYSVCTETVVGDDTMYDVIVFDYWLHCVEGLDELARRLRQRYPHALMIFLRTWLPIHFRRKSSETADDAQNIEEWKASEGFPDSTNIHFVIEKLRADNGYWYFPSHDHADDLLAEIARSVTGILIGFPHLDDPKETLVAYLSRFEYRYHGHVNELGHQIIAKTIFEQIEASLQSRTETDAELIASGTHGDWGNGDECKFWYTSGGAADIDLSDTLTMNEFEARDGWFAVEVNAEGWMDISNRLHDEDFTTRTLWLSYMTSTDMDEYPPLELTVGDSSVILEAYHPDDAHHSIRTVAVGQLPQGETSQVYVKPQSTSTSPFRIVGASFTNEIAQPLEFGFGPTHG